MVNRPLADKRPIGPFAQSQKEVLGISGTPFPNREKNDMVIIYKLDGDLISFIKDFTKTVEKEVNEISSAVLEDVRFDYKKSGITSKGDFTEQAIIMKVDKSEIPIQDASLHRVEQIINRVAETGDLNTVVSEILIEQE